MLPIIDISGLETGDKKRLARIAFEIGRACRDFGFFYISGHGVSREEIAEVFEMAGAFFSLPEELKASVAISANSGNRGYVHLRTEALDPHNSVDNKEAFNIGLELANDDPEIVAGVPFRAVNLWPDLAGFRQTMLAYFQRMHRIGCNLQKAIAIDLGLDPEYFEPMFDRPMATLRLLHYPAAKSSIDNCVGAGTHTDYGNLTLLATDEVGGLEVRTVEGRWIDAPPIKGTYICNIGDCLMRWTNGIYVSNPHRVSNPVGRHRYSIAFFLDANPDAMVEAVEGSWGPDRPQRFAAIRASDYLESRLAETYGYGAIG